MPRGRPKKVKIPLEDNYESEIIRRIGECEVVVNELDNSSVWHILQKDLSAQREMLDNHWQEITEPDKLQKARELKHATMHILNIKGQYKEELEAKKKELEGLQNSSKVIQKDYDSDANTER